MRFPFLSEPLIMVGVFLGGSSRDETGLHRRNPGHADPGTLSPFVSRVALFLWVGNSGNSIVLISPGEAGLSL